MCLKNMDTSDTSSVSAQNIGTDYSFKHKIVWTNALFFLILHIVGMYGWLLIFIPGNNVKIMSYVWAFITGYTSGEGVTIGAHRMFSHKAFKGTPLLRAILIAMHTMAGQNSIFTWCRDHRLHHRYSDTDADPHNSKRGFFFSHVGWLMTKKHPAVVEMGRTIDLSDIKADWMVMFQKKYFLPLHIILGVVIPVWIPVHFWGESWINSFLLCYVARYALSLNFTWLVNSAAHLYGTRPYDRSIQSVETWFVSVVTLGEGWHNYHHAYPWDYKAAELPMFLNFTAMIIRFLDKIGLAYDLRTVPQDVVDKRVLRTGDGTHFKLGYDEARQSITAIGPVHPLNPTYNKPKAV